MEPAKKFRPMINDNVVKSMFTKKQKNIRKVSDTDIRPKIVEVFNIPSEMLPKFKALPQERKEIVNPENWTVPEKKPKKTREEIFKAERANIRRQIDEQQAYSRGARNLTSAVMPANNKISSDQEIDEAIFRQRKLEANIFERKNRSHVFMQSFLKRTSSIRSEMEKKMKKGKRLRTDIVMTKRPKLASGVNPDADEIVL